MPSIGRRTFLVAGLSALAGCGFGGETTGDAAPGTATSTATPSPTPAGSPTPETVRLPPGEGYETDAGWTVTVRGIRVRRYVVQHGTVHPKQRWRPRAQFATAAVAVAGTDDRGPTDLDLAAETDVTEGRSDRVLLAGDGAAAGTERLGFPVPFSPAPSSGGVVWRRADAPAVRWEFGPDQVDALARPPEFEVRGFDVPDEAADGDRVPATLTVANVGDRDGTFRAGLGDAAMSAQPLVAVDVPAGERVEHNPRTPCAFPGRGRTDGRSQLARLVGPHAVGTDCPARNRVKDSCPAWRFPRFSIWLQDQFSSRRRPFRD